MQAKKQKNLLNLKNVGKATLQDLHLLGIQTVEDLACQDASNLFEQLERLTGCRQDPCVWDVFAAIIHEPKTGKSTVWWAWTAQRKLLQKSGSLRHVV